jgi:hypothetical protein
MVLLDKFFITDTQQARVEEMLAATQLDAQIL